MNKKISVITGGAGGLGAAVGAMLGTKTALVLCGRRKEALEQQQENFRYMGIESYIYQLDVSDQAATEESAKYCASLGDIVNVIHTAGLTPANTEPKPLIDVNLSGTINVVNAFYPYLAENAVMINFASVAGHNFEKVKGPEMRKVYWETLEPLFNEWDQPDFISRVNQVIDDVYEMYPKQAYSKAHFAYRVSKAFVIHFSQANILRFSKKNCRILSVSPGCYLTPMHQLTIDLTPEASAQAMALIPCQRWGHPYEMAALINFLCSPEAAYINGVDILADAGYSFAYDIEQLS